MREKNGKRGALPSAAPQRRQGGYGGPLGMGTPREKPKNFKGTMKKLVRQLRPYLGLFILCLFCAIGSVVFTILGPIIMEGATREIFEGFMRLMSGGPGIDFNAVVRVIWVLVAIFVISSILNFIQSFILADMTQKISYNLRKEMSEKINRLPLNYFDTKTHGEILSRIVNDVDTVANSLNQSLTQFVTSIVTVVGILVVMLIISPLMTLVAVVTVPMSAVLVGVVIKFSQKHFRRQAEYTGHVNGQVEEIYGGQIVVTAFNAQDKAVADFDGFNDTLYESAWKSQFLSGIIWPAMNLIGNIGYVGVSVLGGILAGAGTIGVESILTFIQYIRRFNMPIMQLGQISNMLQSTVAAAERVFEFLEESELPAETPADIALEDIKGGVEFKDVEFGYNEETAVIKGFTTTVNPGETIAIVGPTGGGKTTIVKLLMRFYELNSGEILIDGHNITGFRRDELRSILAMVLQDTWLFNGSIWENLRYGNPDVTDDEIRAAARLARVDHFVRTLPEGYNMELNEEASNISGGQKQLITIARAILKNPKILILDEATSSVDTRTEVLIQEAMVNLMKGTPLRSKCGEAAGRPAHMAAWPASERSERASEPCAQRARGPALAKQALGEGRTSFIIAHRLSTIRGADRILVVKDGGIAEQGSHDELLAANGYYTELYKSQFEG